MKSNMNITAFFRDLFMVEAECTLSFAVIGSLFARSAAISYAHFFIPLALGVICMVPCLPVYLKENMTIRQIIVQRVAELFVIEVVCLWAANLLAGEFLGRAGLFAVAACTVFFDFLSYFVMYRMEKAEAARLNKKLKEIAENVRAESERQTAILQNQPKTEVKIELLDDNDRPVPTALSQILYFEADAEKVFAYTADEIYQVRMRLYQVETLSRTEGVIRVSKSHLVNPRKIQSVRPALNSRLYARMPNGEEILVSRKYAPRLKEVMG